MAIVDMRKLENYCLDPNHLRGRHKARAFRAALGVARGDAAWLRQILLDGARMADAMKFSADKYGERWRIDLRLTRQNRSAMVRTLWIISDRRRCPPVRHLLGNLMTETGAESNSERAPLNTVALLADFPAEGLARGQVGTIVEALDDTAVLVEFSDDDGKAYALVPCQRSQLLLLRHAPQAA